MKDNKGVIVPKAFKELYVASPVLFVASYALTLIQGISKIFPIITMQRLFDSLTDGKNVKQVSGYLLLFVASRVVCHLINFVVNGVYEYYNMISGFKMDNNVNRNVYESDAIEFEKDSFLQNIVSAYRGTKSIRNFIDTYMLILFLYMPEMLVIIAYLYNANRFLPLLMIPIIVSSVISLRIQKKQATVLEEKSSFYQKKIMVYDNLLFGIRSIIENKIVGYEKTIADKINECISDKSELKYQYARKKNRLRLIENVALVSGNIIYTVVLTICFANNIISLGLFAALLTSLDELFGMIREVIEVVSNGVSEEISRIMNYFKFVTCNDHITKGVKDIDGIDTITFENVSFKYPGSDRYSLENVSFEIKKGEHIALVGENGSGKTTIIKLLCGIYSPTTGIIKVNGININEYDKKAIFQLFTAVFQNYGKYALPVTENIVLAEKLDDDKMTKIRNIKELNVISKIDKGAILSKEFGNTELSGGQWQQIAIARANYRDREVYLLDEPTSAIDPLEEKRIYELFKKITVERTSIIVTHRMSAVRLADKILVLEKGNLIGCGSHEELIDSCDKYNKMWNSQAALYTA